MYLLVMLYMIRRVGVFFLYWLIMFFWVVLGIGMVIVMVVWNRLRRGFKVTMGLIVIRFLSSLDIRFGEIG